MKKFTLFLCFIALSVYGYSQCTPQINKQNARCNGACDGSASAQGQGGGPYTYSWAPGGQTTQSITGLCAGTYTVSVTNANNCVGTQTVTITQPSQIVSNSSSQPSTNCTPCNGTATVAPTGGPTGNYYYSWYHNGATTASVNALCPGTYIVRIRDWYGGGGTSYCVIFDTIVVAGGPNVPTVTTSKTNVSCNGDSNGVATVNVTGGQTPYAYSWAPGAQTTASITGLKAGTYTCVVTAGGGCVITKTIVISQPTAITLNTTKTDANCNANNGTATANPGGGGGSFTYLWTPGGQTTKTATGLAPNTYTVVVTDANNCTKTSTAIVNGVPAPTINATGSTTSCNPCTGTATASVVGATGPYTFTWTPGNYSTQNVSGLCPSVYTVTLTDKDGCTDTDTAQVVGPSNMVLNTTATNVSCNGAQNGTVNANVTGGGNPFSYSWVPGGATSQNVSGLSGGCYTVTVTDANNCTLSSSSCVNEPAKITVNFSGVTSTSCGLCNGAATASASGGLGPKTYSWVPGNATTATISGVCAGKYYVHIKDSTNCTAIDSVTINANPVSTVSASGSGTSCNPCNGTASANATGSGPFTYAWVPGNYTTANASGLCAGIYTVTVTDANNCIYTDTAHIVGPTNLAATSNCQDITCNGAANGVLSVTPTGGNPGYTYSWTPAGFTSQTVSNVNAGTYTVFVSDQSGCSYVTSCTIVNPPALTGGATTTNASSSTACDGTANATFNGGTGAITYLWTPGGQTTAAVTGLCVGNYVVCATDAKGCKSCDTVSVSFTTGVFGNQNSNVSVVLYPNPTNNQLNVVLSLDKLTLVSYQVYNELGQLMLEDKQTLIGNAALKTIATDKLNNGIYYLVIRYNDIHVSRKFTKMQ